MPSKLPKNKIKEIAVTTIRYEPPRAPARLEGVVKNKGIKPVKKAKKDKPS